MQDLIACDINIKKAFAINPSFENQLASNIHFILYSSK
jgi:hypothetical protein